MPSTALVPTVPALDPNADVAADHRAKRFLERVATLPPEAWGRLDAIGARHTAPDLWGALARTRAVTSALEAARTPAPATVLVGVGVLALAVGRLLVEAPLRALGIDGGTPRWARRPGGERTPVTRSEARATLERVQRLWDLAATQPGGVGPAIAVLAPALVAVGLTRDAEAALAGAFYAPVEPIIPIASLG